MIGYLQLELDMKRNNFTLMLLNCGARVRMEQDNEKFDFLEMSLFHNVRGMPEY